MRECQHCRQPVSDQARFCEKCGAPLEPGDGLPSELTVRIRQLMADGQKIEAIRVLREATGIGLAEAKQLVEAAERGNRSDPRNLPDDEFERDLLELVKSGQKIEAIKHHRERTGLGLKESKDAVEALAARYGVAPHKSGCAGVLVLGVMIALGYALFH